MALDAGLFVDVSFGIIESFQCLPVERGAVFKKFAIDIFDPVFGFRRKVTMTLGWQVAIDAMGDEARFVVVVLGESPVLVRHRMDVARDTVLIGRGVFRYSVQ